eukprot:5254080-Ditylum_brightwellii.AAC.1
MYIKRKPDDSVEVATIGRVIDRPIKVTAAHGIMGHVNEADTCKLVKYLDYEVKKGALSPCEACVEAKAKQKSLPTSPLSAPPIYPTKQY